MPISFPYSFVDDTDAEANEVNANFDAASDGLDEAISDSQVLLAAPYRTLHTGSGVFLNAVAVVGVFGTGAYIISPLGFGSEPADPFYLAAADYSVSGLSTKLRIRAQHFTSTAQTRTLTVGLYSVNSLSGNAATLGTVVSGSTVPFALTGANTRATGSSGDFSFPTDGFYVVGVSPSGSTNANSLLSYQLQLHHT